jgi:hypothetical protein
VKALSPNGGGNFPAESLAMKKPQYGVLLTLLCVCSFAQEMPRYAPATRDPDANSRAWKTWRVCLKNEDGKTTLIGEGKQYEALSDRVALDRYVGKQVKITGYLFNPEDPSNPEMSNNAAGARTITPAFCISEIEKISDTCPAKE